MDKRVKYISFLVFLFKIICSPSFSQVHFKANGLVLSKEDHSPVGGATITLKRSADSAIIAYTITKQNGSFALEKDDIDFSTFAIEVSHISYVSEKIYFTTDSKNLIKVFEKIIFSISPKINQLKSIVINSRGRPVIINNDTIEFNVKLLKTPEVRKVEDLIKNLQGFNVDATGSITYNGRQVEKILIEGEDLADKSYKLISKNLDAAFVDKVQVIKNFSDDRLLREVEKSNKIGINLKINNDFKNKLSLGVDIGLSKEGKQDVGQNSIYLTKGIKFLSLLNYNNTGNISGKEIKYFYKQGEHNYGGSFDDELSIGIVKPSRINVPDLSDSYKNDNDNLNSAIMASWKVGKTIKMKFLSGYTTSKLRNAGGTIMETTISSTDKWMIETNQAARYSENSMVNRITLQHDNSGNNTGSYSFDFFIIKQNNLFDEISQGDVHDTLQEQLHNNSKSIHFNGSETFRINQKSVFKVDLNYSKERISQNFSVLTNRLFGFFSVDPSYSMNKQNLSYNSHVEDLILRYIGKSSTFSYNLGFQLSGNMNDYANSISLSSWKPGNVDSNYPANLLNPAIVKYALFGLASRKVGRQSVISIGGSFGQSFLNVIKNESKKLLFFKSFMEIKKNISEFKFLAFQYSLKRAIPDIEYFSPKNLISGNISIMQPPALVESALINEANLTYVEQNILQNSQFFASATYRKSSNEYNLSGVLLPEYAIYSYFPTKNNTQFIALVNGERFIAPIKSKIVLQFQGSTFKRSLSINQKWKDNISNLVSVQLKFLSSFKLPINLELSTRIQYFQNRFLNERNGDSHFWQNENSAKTKIYFSENIYSSISYKYYSLSKDSKFDAFEFYTSFKMKKNFIFSITVHNFLNSSAFSQKSISPAIVGVNSFRVVPRYILGKISILF